MAIIVEEEKRGPSLFLVLGTLIVLGALFAGTYYLFFAPAPLVEIVSPKELETTSAVTKIELDPSGVTDSNIYKGLRQYVQKPELVSPGRVNPFEPF
ncbi:MAG: hypothetical protein HYW37_02315 [Candidatus Colwellbacteria bacterium]|nr:hypothetical protein [Candidatus Colwellbacteria bacterium]